MKIFLIILSLIFYNTLLFEDMDFQIPNEIVLLTQAEAINKKFSRPNINDEKYINLTTRIDDYELFPNYWIFQSINSKEVLFTDAMTGRTFLLPSFEYARQKLNDYNVQGKSLAYWLPNSFPYLEKFPEQVPQLLERFPKKIGLPSEILNYSFESLDDIDKKLNQLSSWDKHFLCPYLYAYLGQIAINEVNGKWIMRPDPRGMGGFFPIIQDKFGREFGLGVIIKRIRDDWETERIHQKGDSLAEYSAFRSEFEYRIRRPSNTKLWGE